MIKLKDLMLDIGPIVAMPYKNLARKVLLRKEMERTIANAKNEKNTEVVKAKKTAEEAEKTATKPVELDLK